MIYNLSFKHELPSNAIIIDVTSNSDSDGRYLSPFNIGPVDLYDGYSAQNIENAYQFAKLYPHHIGFDDKPNAAYFEWAMKGWNTKTPIKHPFGAWNNCVCHWWKGERLDRLRAQNEIFVPLYKEAVVKTKTYSKLKSLYEITTKDIVLLDYEGYDHRALNMDWNDVLNHEDWSIGQGFVLCMILEGYI